MHHSASWAAYFVVMRFHSAVRPICDFEVSQNVKSSFCLDEVSDYSKHCLRSLGRKVDLVLHIVAAEFHCLQRDVTCSCYFSTSSHLRPQKPRLISLLSHWSYSSRRVDKEKVFAVGVGTKNFGKLFGLLFDCYLHLVESSSSHVVAAVDNYNLCFWEN